MSEVKVWYMTEEERQAYIKKHPIIPTKETKGISYVDYNWRGQKAADSRWGKTEKEGEFI